LANILVSFDGGVIPLGCITSVSSISVVKSSTRKEILLLLKNSKTIIQEERNTKFWLENLLETEQNGGG
jgi:hypothetical protein